MKAITMYRGRWYEDHLTPETETTKTITETENKIRFRINWDAIVMIIIMIASLVLGGM